MHAIDSLVFCTFTDQDTEIYQQLLPLFFVSQPQKNKQQKTKQKQKQTEQVQESKQVEVDQSIHSDDDDDASNDDAEDEVKTLEELVGELEIDGDREVKDTEESSNHHVTSSLKVIERAEEKVIETQPVQVISITPTLPI
jgi:predicted alpha/beta hydrolase family esterase